MKFLFRDLFYPLDRACCKEGKIFNSMERRYAEDVLVACGFSPHAKLTGDVGGGEVRRIITRLCFSF